MEVVSVIVPLAVVFVLAVITGRAFVIHRRLSRMDEQRYRQYVADMEAVNRRFHAAVGRADSVDSPPVEEKS